MLTTTAVVSLIASLGWLVLNWQAFKSDAKAAEWSRSTQFQMVLIWVVIIAGLALALDNLQS